MKGSSLRIGCYSLIITISFIFIPLMGYGGKSSVFPPGENFLSIFSLSTAIGGLAVISGIGAEVLYLPFTTLLLSYPLIIIKKTSFFIMMLSALITGPLLLKKDFTHYRTCLPLALTGGIGALTGSLADTYIPSTILRIITGIVLLYIALCHIIPNKSTHLLNYFQKKLPYSMFFFSGIITGISGIGTGYIDINLLNSTTNLSITTAVATAKITSGAKGLGSMVLSPPDMGYLPIIIPSILGIIVGSFMGLPLISSPRTCKNIRTGTLLLLFLSSLKLILDYLIPHPVWPFWLHF